MCTSQYTIPVTYLRINKSFLQHDDDVVVFSKFGVGLIVGIRMMEDDGYRHAKGLMEPRMGVHPV